MTWSDARLLDLFGIEVPIIAAPMANFAGVDLAVGVAEAGGLGSLPCAVLKPDQIRAGIAEFRSRRAAPLNANFFCHIEAPDDLSGTRRGSSALLPISPSLAWQRRSCRSQRDTRHSAQWTAPRSRSFARRS